MSVFVVVSIVGREIVDNKLFSTYEKADEYRKNSIVHSKLYMVESWEVL